MCILANKINVECANLLQHWT